MNLFLRLKKWCICRCTSKLEVTARQHRPNYLYFVSQNNPMPLTASNPYPKGVTAPDFVLTDVVSEKEMALQSIKGDLGTVIFFICNHCPFVIHINKELVRMANEYGSKGIGFIAISSNDINKYPADSPEKMKIQAMKEGYPFPYLYDETQEVAKAYSASCTPDLYVFDSDLKSVYHGQLDNSRPGNEIPVSGRDLRNVLEIMLQNGVYQGNPKPSIGCGIKWK